MPRGIKAAIFGLLLIVVAIGAVVVRREYQAAAACNQAQVAVRSFGDSPIGTGPRDITVLGDSYSMGYKLEDPRENAWPVVVGRELGATVLVDGFPSSGFATASPCQSGTAYGARLDNLPADADITIVQGGLNDLLAVDRVAHAAREVVEAAPGQVVLVGPPPAPHVLDTAALDNVDATLAAIADDVGVRYVSTIDWTGLDYGPDQLHLTRAGHEDFGRRVAAEIQAAARP